MVLLFPQISCLSKGQKSSHFAASQPGDVLSSQAGLRSRALVVLLFPQTSCPAKG